ncbi:hypothetical protein HDU93_001735 [Gonapodya sp. JEL0774]|nr:hypothetical protein HDU93_001735 [Gonapodya sp. JEL0774]
MLGPGSSALPLEDSKPDQASLMEGPCDNLGMASDSSRNSGLGSPDTVVAVAEYLAAHELEGQEGGVDTITIRPTPSLPDGSSGGGSDNIPTLLRYRPNVENLRTELEQMHLGSEAKGRGTRSLPDDSCPRPPITRHMSAFSENGRYHDDYWTEISARVRTGGLSDTATRQQFGHMSYPRATFPGRSNADFSIPLIIEDFDPVDGVRIPERPFSAPESSAAYSTEQPQPLAISYDDLTKFRPYISADVLDSDRLSVLSYPGSSFIPPPQTTSLSDLKPPLPPSASAVDNIRVADKELGELDFRLEWKSAADSTYKDLMGMLGTDACRIQRGWEYKRKDLDSLQWSVTYSPGKHENLRYDPNGLLPRIELTIFYNSIQLFLVAAQTLPRKIPNIRVPTFSAEFVEPLRVATEWAEIETQGASGMNNTVHLCLVVRAQGDPLNERCKNYLETWTRHEYAKIRSSQRGFLGRAAKVLTQRIQGRVERGQASNLDESWEIK